VLAVAASIVLILSREVGSIIIIESLVEGVNCFRLLGIIARKVEIPVARPVKEGLQ
jgi:hypothetical protein